MIASVTHINQGMVSISVLMAHALLPGEGWADWSLSNPSKVHDIHYEGGHNGSQVTLSALNEHILHWAKFLMTKWKKDTGKTFIFFFSENLNLAALSNADWQQSDWWACITKTNWSCNVVAHAAFTSLLLEKRARAALGNRLCSTASADSAASVQGWLFVGGMKSGYYFKRNSHRKNVGFKINKWVHGSWIKLQYKSNAEH